MSSSPVKIAPNALGVGRRLLSGASPSTSSSITSCSLQDRVVSSPLASMSLGNASVPSRPISSMGRSPISHPSSSSTSVVPPTYSAFRNKASMPFDSEPGQPYTSPYSEFFANIEAGRTSLGTTEEMEQRAFELQEQRLKCGIPESELRFRTVSYGRYQLPPYVAPGEHRVTVQVALSAIPFKNEQEREIFLEIVGPRFKKDKGYLQLSSEKFASRIENKRHLVDMIERIVSNAQSLAEEFAAADDSKTAATAK